MNNARRASAPGVDFLDDMRPATGRDITVIWRWPAGIV